MANAADELAAKARARAEALRPDPVGPGQTLLRQLDAERQERQRPAELGRFPFGRLPDRFNDPRWWDVMEAQERKRRLKELGNG